MEQFDLYVHGVPVGHEICGCDRELDYIKGFYNHDVKVEVSSMLQIDVVNGSSFYTYLRKKNVRNAEGRPGSYFGLTVSFTDRYCTNVQMLYEILDAIYRQVCVNSLIKAETGGDRFLVKQISTASYKNHLTVDFIKAAFKNNVENLQFGNLKGFSSSSSEAKFSLSEVDSPLFRETLKSKRILVSPEYGTASVAYNNLLKEVEPIRNENVQLKAANTQLTESKNGLSKEVERLEKELADLNVSASKKYKKELDDLQAQLEKCRQEKDKLDAKIKEATSAVDLIDEPFKKLTRLLAGRFQEKDENDGKKTSKGCPESRSKHSKKVWFAMGNLILLLVVAVLCGLCYHAVSKLSESVAMMQKYEPQGVSAAADTIAVVPGTGQDEVAAETGTGAEQPVYDDYSKCYIDISPYNPKNGDKIQKGKTYTLSVMKGRGKANVPDGTWDAQTGIPNVAGIIITGNTFKVDETISNPTNVLIRYIVNGKAEKNKTITVE